MPFEMPSTTRRKFLAGTAAAGVIGFAATASADMNGLSGDQPAGMALRMRQLLSPSVQWTRDAIRLRPGVFVFRDR